MRKNSKKVTTGCRQPCDILYHWSGKGYLSSYKVFETKYFYKTELENVKSDEDMQLDYEISYFIDFKGNLIGKEIPGRIDIFNEFKEIVPFELK